jgi:hypothetical protein
MIPEGQDRFQHGGKLNAEDETKGNSRLELVNDTQKGLMDKTGR